MRGFLSEQTEVYEKSLQIAKLLYSNEKNKKKDPALVNKIKRSFRDFLNLQTHKITEPQTESIKVQKSPSPTKGITAPSPIPSYKTCLNRSLEESNHNIKLSRAGKRNVRYSTKEQPSIKTLNPTELFEKPLPHVSLLDGKLSKPLNLPYFTEYNNSAEVKEEAQDAALEGIERCEKTLENFYKSLGGMELFCSSNPGVPWNNDRKVLHKLYENPGYKLSIIRNYNENLLGRKARGTFSRISLVQKRFTLSHSSFDSSPKGQRACSPNSESKLNAISEFQRAKTPSIDQPEIILDRCLTRFSVTRTQESQKLVDIFTKLKKNRPWYLRQKWDFIMKDSEKYKNKLDTLMKFKKIKIEVNSRQEKRLIQNKDQAKIYTELLEMMKNIENVKEIEVGFLNFIKQILEEGWLISKELITKVLKKLSKSDQENLKPILAYLADKV